MNSLNTFQELKKEVLLTYQKHYPFFEGNWKTFSSQDIQNLIDAISNETKQTISEKWIYTHLKAATNGKLPRKDMLDILSQWVGYSGWDEYVFKNKISEATTSASPKNKISLKFSVIILALIVTVSLLIYFWNKENSKVISVKNAFTNKEIPSDDLKATIIENDIETPIEIKDSQIKIEAKDSIKIILKSPYYKDKTVVVNRENTTSISLQPDDYPMMLKGFMKSDIKDWQTRKQQLQKILADDLEVLVLLKNDLGMEYFNKQEFSEKLIVPSVSIKKMKVIAIESNEKKEINFIRIVQE